MARIESKKLTEAAEGEQCTVRLPVICNHNPETTVAAHVPSDMKGMAIKSDDIFIAFACSDCHAVIDRQDLRYTHFHIADLTEMHIRGMMRTWKRLIEKGLIIVPQDKPKIAKSHKRKTKSDKPKRKWPSRKIPSRPFS